MDRSPAPGRVELEIIGMSCENCVRHVTEALRGVPGVRQIRVDLGEARAEVDFDPAEVADPAAMIAAVREAGYDAKVL